MKPTRDDLERWAGGEGCLGFTLAMLKADRTAAARLALDLMDEVSRLTGVPVDGVVGNAPPPAPSPLLDDALWRRFFAAVVWLRSSDRAGEKEVVSDADALLAELRKREV